MKKELIYQLLKTLSENGTCSKMKTAAIITRDSVIISLGYNGAVRGSAQCNDVGCLNIKNHCQSAVHAEENALLNAARIGVSVNKGTCWCLHFPCRNCLKHLLNAGINEIHFFVDYPDEANKILCQRYVGEGLLKIFKEKEVK